MDAALAIFEHPIHNFPPSLLLALRAAKQNIIGETPMFNYGRINRTTYWALVAMIVAITVIARLLIGDTARVSEVVLLWIAVPRLHDIGRSGWWAGGVLGIEVAGVIVTLVTQPSLAGVQLAAGIFVLLLGVLMIVLGCLPGEPEANDYGDAPPPGFGSSRTRTPRHLSAAKPFSSSPSLSQSPAPKPGKTVIPPAPRTDPAARHLWARPGQPDEQS